MGGKSWVIVGVVLGGLVSGPGAWAGEGEGETPPAAGSAVAEGGSPAAPGGAAEAALPAEAAPTVPLPEGVEALRYAAGALTVRAQDADLPALLAALGRATGVAFRVDPKVVGAVTFEAEKKPIAEIVKLILSAVENPNYAFAYEGETLKSVWVLPQGEGREKAEIELAIRRFNAEDRERLRRHFQLPADPDDRRLMGKIARHLFNASAVGTVQSNEISLTWQADPAVLAGLDAAEAYARWLLETYGHLVGLSVDVAELRLVERSRRPGERKYYIFAFEQYYGGIRVYARGASVSVLEERLTFSGCTEAHIPVSLEPSLTLEQALAVATERYRSEWRTEKLAPWAGEYETLPKRFTKIWKTELLIFPVYPKTGPKNDPVFHLCWAVGKGPVEYFVDAHTGDIVERLDHFDRGAVRVTGEVFGAVAPGGGYVDAIGEPSGRAPLPAMVVEYGEQEGRTNAQGELTLPEGVTEVTTNLADPEFFGELQALSISHAQGVGPHGGTYTLTTTGDPNPHHQYDRGVPYWSGVDADQTAPGNVYHQLRRALDTPVFDAIFRSGKGFNAELHVTLDPRDDLWGASSPYEIGRMGCDGWVETGFNIQLAASASRLSDVIFHELSHAAVCRQNGTSLGKVVGQKGVSEALANYFACRINDDPVFHYLGALAGRDGAPTYPDKDYSQAPPPTHLLVRDEDGDGFLTELDWQTYHGDHAVAGALWNLELPNAGSTPADRDALILNAVKEMDLRERKEFAPEHLYKRMHDEGKAAQGPKVLADALWAAFSRYHLVLWAAPGQWETLDRNLVNATEATRPVADQRWGATVDWMDYRELEDGNHASRDYVVVRQEVGMPDPDFACRLGTRKCAPDPGAASLQYTADPPAGPLRDSLGAWSRGESWWYDASAERGKTYTYQVLPCAGAGDVLDRPSNAAEVTPLASPPPQIRLVEIWENADGDASTGTAPHEGYERQIYAYDYTIVNSGAAPARYPAPVGVDYLATAQKLHAGSSRRTGRGTTDSVRW